MRRARSEDAAGIAHVHVRSWQVAYRDMLSRDYLERLSVAQRQRQWQARLKHDETRVMVAESDGRVIGFCAWGSCRDTEAVPCQIEVYSFYLDPAYWSRGVGRRLWQHALAEIRQGASTRISLWVLTANQRALRFYRSLGFECDSGSRTSFELGGVTLGEERWVGTPEGLWRALCPA
ncbi:GNAT family N-acetyltransferase [Halomonas caseinilytica]|uniref:GNAT family N-acetyltransferase n=1 Tax=Halomonas caseinilytica TaxID=438744 RepID=UPI0007E57205|nr:N-acetyltransferase [Halomonas caseinilytica]SEM68221.1 Ribosomal protein S18 acetylase RimI [Halomonas caseinilytica]